jgi:hypothetical protein
MEIKENAFADKKKYYFITLLFTLLFLLPTCMTVYAQQCEKEPITKEFLADTLKKYPEDKDKLVIIDEIKKCGVDFQPTKDDIKDLHRVGASNNLIEEVRKNYLPIKPCESVKFIKIAVIPKGSFGSALMIRNALRRIKCNARDPKPPSVKEPDIDPNDPIILKYFDKAEASNAKSIAAYVRRVTSIPIEAKFIEHFDEAKGTLEIWIFRE